MKRLILITATMAMAAASYAQTAGSTDNSLFRFDANTGSPKEIHKLGTSPEFPFLRNMSSPKQVYAAIRRNDRENTQGMEQLNGLLMAVGFANGAKDLNESNITSYYVAPGTEGNMGSADYNYTYCRLSGDAENFKAWKITADNGNYVYLMAKCGNAFYPKGTTRTACITAPVTLTGDMKEVTLNTSGQKMTNTSSVFVYYHRRHHKRHAQAYPVTGLTDAYPSKPILLRTTNDMQVIPETYKVSLSTPDNTVSVCPDSTLNLTANINVEKTSEYTGNYPDKVKKDYKEVSKKVYRKTARKMRKVERKEARVARLTGVTANV